MQNIWRDCPEIQGHAEPSFPHILFRSQVIRTARIHARRERERN